jgi:hypothetical protein
MIDGANPCARRLDARASRSPSRTTVRDRIRPTDPSAHRELSAAAEHFLEYLLDHPAPAAQLE